MSEYARVECDSTIPIYKFARDCTEADRSLDFRCPICNRPVYLRFGEYRKNHFYGDHLNGKECKMPARVKVAPDGHVLNLEAMLGYSDKPILPKVATAPEEEGGADYSKVPETDNDNSGDDEVIIPGMVHLNRILPLYRYIQTLGGNDILDVDSDLTVSDFVVNEKTIFSCRKDGINKQSRLVMTRRFKPDNLPNAPRKPGYIMLRDAFTRDDKDAIYFLVRLAEPSQDKKFHDLLFGSEADGVVKCPKKHIILLATWTRVANKNYQVYEAVINSRCYAFVD